MNQAVQYELPSAKKAETTLVVFLCILVGVTLYAWATLFLPKESAHDTLFILDVGQGDSQLITLRGEKESEQVAILIDAGKGRIVLSPLSRTLPNTHKKYIDILLMTHPDMDHIGGFTDILDRYEVGLVITNGGEADTLVFKNLMQKIKEVGVPVVALKENDRIRYGEHSLFVLAPSLEILGDNDRNEESIVLMLKARSGVRALLTSDAGLPSENIILSRGHDLSADILKVGHHGSKHSTSANLLSAVRPTVSIIGVGQNHYGHPSLEVLDLLALSGSVVYRTDTDGTLAIPLSKDPGVGYSQSPQAKLAGAKESEPTGIGAFFQTASLVFTRAYGKETFTTLSLHALAQEERVFSLTPHIECSFETQSAPLSYEGGASVLLNEIAWMGAKTGATHEWIELKNISAEEVNLSGWQIVNENERLHFTFPQQSFIKGGGVVLLARGSVADALNIKVDNTFTGSIRNQNEGVRLFNSDCVLVDQILAKPRWPAGDNKTKQTAERASALVWKTSAEAGGTPGK